MEGLDGGIGESSFSLSLDQFTCACGGCFVPAYLFRSFAVWKTNAKQLCTIDKSERPCWFFFFLMCVCVFVFSCLIHMSKF